MIKTVIEIPSNFAEILQNNETRQKSLHVIKSFKTRDVISKFSAATVSIIPTYLTVQTGFQEHITLQPTFLQYINHSCNPNVFFDTTQYELVALKDIKVGDELTFFYPSSEWDMTQSFECNCGSKNCLHNIKGAAHISKEILANYKLTDFILSMLDK
jgi:SET domain-containing protein